MTNEVSKESMRIVEKWVEESISDSCKNETVHIGYKDFRQNVEIQAVLDEMFDIEYIYGEEIPESIFAHLIELSELHTELVGALNEEKLSVDLPKHEFIHEIVQKIVNTEGVSDYKIYHASQKDEDLSEYFGGLVIESVDMTARNKLSNLIGENADELYMIIK